MMQLSKMLTLKASLVSLQVAGRNVNLLTNFPAEVMSGPKFLSTSSALNFNVIKIIQNTVNAGEETVKKCVKNFKEETHKFREEARKSYFMNDRRFQIRHPDHTIDMLFTFEKEEVLKNFMVTTDSTHNSGYSSASIEITPNGTLLFSGELSNRLPKTGNVSRTGFANFMTRRKMKPFFREGYYNWKRYTHLVLKVRGEGRRYVVILSTPFKYEETKTFQFLHPFYTRGGPYWQLTKIPFTHFAFGSSGCLNDDQSTIPLNKVAKLGITIMDDNDGPFKLEVDYIGLEFQERHRKVSPYEQYYLGKNYV